MVIYIILCGFALQSANLVLWVLVWSIPITLPLIQDLEQWSQCAVDWLWRSMAGVSFLLIFRRHLSDLFRELFSQSVG
jgi:hypothetical protein